MTKHNDDKVNNLNTGSNKLLPSSNGKSVTYAEHVASPSLQTSIHAPHKYTTTKPVRLSPT